MAHRLNELRDQLGPVTLARERLLPVPDPFLPLFPLGGLQRGSSVGFDGAGATSVALALAAAALGQDRWMAVVGVEDLGLVAAAELGVRLDRLLLVEAVPARQLASVVAVLVEAADLIMIDPRQRLGQRDARRLTARIRERESVLLHLDGGRSWPEALSMSITTRSEEWEGLGQGHGHLKSRRMTVSATGRRSSARPRAVSVLLPAPGPAVVETAPSTHPTPLSPTPPPTPSTTYAPTG